MAAIKRVQYHPPPPHSFWEGPRILQKLRDVVFQIVELPLYILSFLLTSALHLKEVGEGSLYTVLLYSVVSQLEPRCG